MIFYCYVAMSLLLPVDQPSASVMSTPSNHQSTHEGANETEQHTDGVLSYIVVYICNYTLYYINVTIKQWEQYIFIIM